MEVRSPAPCSGSLGPQTEVAHSKYMEHPCEAVTEVLCFGAAPTPTPSEVSSHRSTFHIC